MIGALLPSPATTFMVLDVDTAKCLTRQMHGFHGQAPRRPPAGKRMIRTMGFHARAHTAPFAHIRMTIPDAHLTFLFCAHSGLRVVQNAPKPPPEVQGGPGQTLGASKKCVPTENPEERVA